ncbi:MAG: hypothetical protein ACPGTP_04090 [Bacteroidia bacterium]
MRQIFIASFITAFLAFTPGCKDTEESPHETVWDESVNGELSGDLNSPTEVTFQNGNNRIMGGSTPWSEAYCTTFDGGPQDSIIPYFPGHENYVDAITFSIPEGKKLVSILVEKMTLTPFHLYEDYPCIGPFEDQLGAFTALNASNKIDWNSNTVVDFISLPVENPLIGIGFTRDAGDDLLQNFREPFPMPGYDGINDSTLTIGQGTYTFWWKEGQNETDYTLNFVVE